MGGVGKAITGAVGSILGTGSTSVNVDAADDTEMPTEDTDAVKAARQKSIIRQQQRSGRNSTILTSGKLGG
ncbi:TPA: hypothetical protein I8235_000035 [Kluyvera intermedia]|nr:hypothetical protein [Kluyvera intermedia]